jgi:hypothetical protein
MGTSARSHPSEDNLWLHDCCLFDSFPSISTSLLRSWLLGKLTQTIRAHVPKVLTPTVTQRHRWGNGWTSDQSVSLPLPPSLLEEEINSLNVRSMERTAINSLSFVVGREQRESEGRSSLWKRPGARFYDVTWRKAKSIIYVNVTFHVSQ